MNQLARQIEAVTGSTITDSSPLGVGFGLTGLRCTLADGRKLAVKAHHSGEGGGTLELEGRMLAYLRAHSNLPVPELYHSSPDLLVMAWIDSAGGLSRSAQHHAAELLAELHGVRQPHFGFDHDTLIGPLHQPNPPTDEWLPFFRDQRLMFMANAAHSEGRIDGHFLARLENFAARLDEYLPEPDHPALLHGDLWSGNILARTGRIAGLIDPAIYFGHPEIELAFTTLFGTFGAPFFEAYEALAPLPPGFHDLRRDIYNIYPNLVHVRLFGGSYLPPIDAVLRRVGA